MTTVENLRIADELRPLYQYLVDKREIEQLYHFNPAHLSTFSREVLRQIQNNEPGWIDHVPEEVAEVIQRRGFFGCRRKLELKTSTPVSRIGQPSLIGHRSSESLRAALAVICCPVP